MLLGTYLLNVTSLQVTERFIAKFAENNKRKKKLMSLCLSFYLVVLLAKNRISKLHSLPTSESV